PLVVALPAEGNDRVKPLPGHTLGPLHHRLYIHQLGPVPVRFQDAPAPLDRIILAMVRGLIQQLNRLANSVATWDYAMQTLCPSSTALWAIIHSDLQPRHRHLLGLLQGGPPGFERIYNAITRFEGAAKGNSQLPAGFIHDAARNVLLV